MMKYFSTWKLGGSICIVVISVGFSYKIITLPVQVNLDLPTILSVLLAMFSIGLSAVFYFKAEQSGRNFQDNVYKFTIETPVLLSRMHEGFGEQLRNVSDTIKKQKEVDLPAISKERERIRLKLEESINTDEKNLFKKFEVINKRYFEKKNEIERLEGNLYFGLPILKEIYRRNNDDALSDEELFFAVEEDVLHAGTVYRSALELGEWILPTGKLSSIGRKTIQMLRNQKKSTYHIHE